MNPGETTSLFPSGFWGKIWQINHSYQEDQFFFNLIQKNIKNFELDKKK